MKSSVRNKVRGLIGVILIALAIGCIYYWENYGREEILYQQVVFTKGNIHRNDIIGYENVELIKVEEFLIHENTVKNIESIIGKESKQFIPKGTIMDESYIGYSYLIPNENQYIFEIPRDWIYNSPQTLRRGDEVLLYPIKRDTDRDKNISINENSTENGQTVGDLDIKERKMVIAYVKDGSNYEVEDENAHGAIRLYGTAIIKSIEVIATKEEIKELEELSKKNYQFIIAYK